jgi:hypothetical protein
VQPMDQEVIAFMKWWYQGDHVRTLDGEDNSILALWKKWQVLDAVCGTSQVLCLLWIQYPWFSQGGNFFQI